jgi:hypothetical protein
MRIDKLFGVLVVAGASSTAGLNGCSSSTTTGGGGTDAGGSGTDDSGASSGSGGSMGDGSMGGEGSSCACMPETQVPAWIDCNGCCCWLPAGATSAAKTPICGVEPCCAGKGR